MTIHSMLKSAETARRLVEAMQKQQALKVQMLQRPSAYGSEMARQAVERQMKLMLRSEVLQQSERMLAAQVRLAARPWQLNETLQSSLLVKGVGQVLELQQQMLKSPLATQALRNASSLTPAAYQTIQVMSRTTYDLAEPLSRMVQSWVQPFCRSIQQMFETCGPERLLLPIRYAADSKHVMRRIEHLQAFFEDLEAIKTALEARDPERAIALLKERLSMWVQKAQKMMRKHLRTDYPKSAQARRDEQREAEQELLYSFITRYKEVSAMNYRELMSLGNAYAWMRSEMEKTMYESLTERGYRPGRVYIYENPDAFFKDVDKLKDLNFDAKEAKQCLEWLCAGTEDKLLRLNSETASQQLLIIQGIRSGEYLSEDEIKEHHAYKDWRAVRTKMQVFAMGLEV